jgi:Putative ATPase subunit of terminase (gpP-like)
MTSRRETNMLKLIDFLWAELHSAGANIGAIEWMARQDGMAWALPTKIDHIDADEWLTPDQIAHELGYKASTVHVWAHRYGLMQVKGRYRWGDIVDLRTDTTRRPRLNDTRGIS